VLAVAAGIQQRFQCAQALIGTQVSLADLIVLAVAQRGTAAAPLWSSVEVPFSPGRERCLQEQTDVGRLPVVGAQADRLSQLFQSAAFTVRGNFAGLNRAQLLGLSARV